MSAGMMIAFIPVILLVWYTFVVPPGPLGSRRPLREGEVRGLHPSAPDDAQTAGELDWPEYIYPEGRAATGRLFVAPQPPR